MKSLVPFIVASCLVLTPLALAQQSGQPSGKSPDPAAPKTEPKKDEAKKPESKPTEAKPAESKKDEAKKADAKDDKAAMDAAWAKATEVGPNHELLKQWVGEWKTVVKSFEPDGSSRTDEGVMTNEMILGGRFLKTEYDGRMNGKFFRGWGTIGYNNTDKKFESTWIDSMTTATLFMTGSMDSSSKSMVFTGTCTDPMSGKPMPQREVRSQVVDGAWHSEFYMNMGGKEMKVMELNCTKDSKVDKKDDKKATEMKKDQPKTEDKPKK